MGLKSILQALRKGEQKMANLPKHHVYSLVASELEQVFKYVYDVEPDKATIEQKQQFIGVLEEYIDGICNEKES